MRILVLFLLLPFFTFPQDIWVVPGGAGSQNGTNEANAYADPQLALNDAQPGDIIAIKAGVYLTDGITTVRSGTSVSPIQIVGYQNSFGDILATNGPTYTKADYDADSTPTATGNMGDMDGVDMPLFENNSFFGTNNPNQSARGIEINHSYIHVKNIKTQYYEYGIDVDVAVTGLSIDNYVDNRSGNWDSTNPGYATEFWVGSDQASGGLRGHGIRFLGVTNSTITNVAIFNAGHVGIKLQDSDNITMQNSIMHYTDYGNGMDYGFHLYNCDNSTVEDNFFRREIINEGSAHKSRGLLIQCGSDNNVVRRHSSENSIIGITNVSRNNELYDCSTEGSGAGSQGGFRLTGAAEANVIYNFRAENSEGITLYNQDGTQCSTPANAVGSVSTTFVNPIIRNPASAEGHIKLWSFDPSNTSSAGNLTIVNGTFDGGSIFISLGRDMTNLTIVNSSVSNISGSFSSGTGTISSENWINSNFFNNGFAARSGTSITTLDPQYTNQSLGIYTIATGGNLDGIGTDPTVYEDGAIFDFANNARVAPHSVGAYSAVGFVWVDVNASGANNGTSEANAYTNIQNGVNDAQPGDIVYVKAGDYPDQELITVRAGTQQEPIRIIGYNNTPNDIIATNGPTWGRVQWEAQGFGKPTNTGMPNFHFESRNLAPTSGDVSIQINHQWIEVHNIMASYAFTNFSIDADNVTINNCIAYKAGYWVPNQTGWNDAQGPTAPYVSGYGFDTNNDNTIFTNCVSMDNGLVNYFYKGDNSTTRWCESLQHEPGAGTDYAFDYYNSDGNLIEDCYAERYYNSTIGHVGRGLIFQTSSDNNVARRIESVNLKIVLEDARNNVLEDFHCRGEFVTPVNNTDYAGLQIFGQSDFNIFKNFLIEGGNGIEFLNGPTVAAIGQRQPHDRAGSDNYFINFIIRDASGFGTTAIINNRNLPFGSPLVTTASRRNYAINWTVDGNNFSRFVRVAFNGGDFTFINCLFTGFTTTAFDIFADAGVSYDYRFINSNDDPTDNLTFPDNAFTTFTNMSTFAPSFVGGLIEYEIPEGGSLEDAGVEPSFPGIVTPPTSALILQYAGEDYYGNLRPEGVGWDIGVFETGNATPPPVNPPASNFLKKKFVPVN